MLGLEEGINNRGSPDHLKPLVYLPYSTWQIYTHAGSSTADGLFRDLMLIALPPITLY
jgi:hypothetical protein